MKPAAKTLLLICAAALMLIFSIQTTAQKEIQVLPVDEAKKDPTFLAFREKLIAAVKKQDVKFLLETLNPDVQGSYGGDSGIADFKRLWKLDRKNSSLWKELLTVLTNGGTFSKESGQKNKEFCAPFSYTNFPPNFDIFDYQMIFGSNVNLRARPDAKAAVITQLSYNVIKTDYENSIKSPGRENQYKWLKIETIGGKKGFVSAELVRSPIDYRGCFERKNGKWKMTFFLAGD